KAPSVVEHLADPLRTVEAAAVCVDDADRASRSEVKRRTVEGESATIWRPGHGAVKPRSEVRQRPLLAPIGVHDPDVRVAVGINVHPGDLPAVWLPGWRSIDVVANQPAPPAPIGVDHEDASARIGVRGEGDLATTRWRGDVSACSPATYCQQDGKQEHQIARAHLCQCA